MKNQSCRQGYKNANCAEIAVPPTHPGKPNRMRDELEQLRSAPFPRSSVIVGELCYLDIRVGNARYETHSANLIA
jgi:hypothetical protein